MFYRGSLFKMKLTNGLELANEICTSFTRILFFKYCFSHSLMTFLSYDFPVKCFLMNNFIIELILFVCMSITNLPSDEVNKMQPCLQHCMEETMFWFTYIICKAQLHIDEEFIYIPITHIYHLSFRSSWQCI